MFYKTIFTCLIQRISVTEPPQVTFFSMYAGKIKMQNAGCAAPTLAEAAAVNNSPLLSGGPPGQRANPASLCSCWSSQHLPAKGNTSQFKQTGMRLGKKTQNLSFTKVTLTSHRKLVQKSNAKISWRLQLLPCQYTGTLW